MKIRDSSLCDFCCQNVQDLEHLLFFCTETQKLWADVKMFTEKEMKIVLPISIKNIMLGFQGEDENIINCIFLIVKYYIYRQNCSSKPLSKHQVILEIKDVIERERKIAHDQFFQNYSVKQIQKWNGKWKHCNTNKVFNIKGIIV